MPLLCTQTTAQTHTFGPLEDVLTTAPHSAPNWVWGSGNREKGKPKGRKKTSRESQLIQGVYLRNLGLVLVSGVVVVEEVEEGEEEEAAAAS